MYLDKKNASRKGEENQPELSMTATLISHQPGQPKRISSIDNISPKWDLALALAENNLYIICKNMNLTKNPYNALSEKNLEHNCLQQVVLPCLFYFPVHHDCETLFNQLNTVVRSNCQGTQHFNIYRVAQSS